MKKKIAKLFAGLNGIGKDKYQHFAVGAVLATTVLLIVWGLTAGAAALLPARNAMTVHFPADGALTGAATGFGPGTAMYTAAEQPAEAPAAEDAAALSSSADPVRVLHRWTPLLLSVVAVIAAAVVKERCFDERIDLCDLLATLAGGAVVWVPVILT